MKNFRNPYIINFPRYEDTALFSCDPRAGRRYEHRIEHAWYNTGPWMLFLVNCMLHLTFRSLVSFFTFPPCLFPSFILVKEMSLVCTHTETWKCMFTLRHFSVCARSAGAPTIKCSLCYSAVQYKAAKVNWLVTHPVIFDSALYGRGPLCLVNPSGHDMVYRTS